MNRLFCTLAGSLLLAAGISAQPAPEPPLKLSPEEQQLLGPYLTNDFTLKASYEVRDELTGFGTFYGTIWRVETDGAWTITRIIEKKPLLIGKGQLSKKEIYELAKRLAVYDPLSLPSIGKPLVNPHIVTIYYGPKVSALTFGVDQKLTPTKLQDLTQAVSPGGPYVVGKTPVGPAVPPLDPLTRYAGLHWALRNMIQPNLGVKIDIPDRLKQLMQPD